MDVLQDQWGFICDIAAILNSIQVFNIFIIVIVMIKSLLCDPNPNSSVNSEAAKLYQQDRKEYYRRVNLIFDLIEY